MNERRKVLSAIGGAVSAAIACGTLGRTFAADAPRKSFAVTTVNHLSYSSPNYKVTRDFYVELFGMRDVWDDGLKCQLDCGPEDEPNSFYMTTGKPDAPPGIAHFSFGLPDYWNRTNALRDELVRGKYAGVHPDGEAGWFVNGPSGYTQHIVAIKDRGMFPGAAAPCESARSDRCKEAYAAGVKNPESFTKPSGTGFKALYFQYFILHVPDVAKEAEFYTQLMGMKPVKEIKDDVWLRFGENTIALRPTAANSKPYCNEFGLVIDRYDEARVKAELARRGIASTPSPAGGLLIRDPNGLEVGIAGKA